MRVSRGKAQESVKLCNLKGGTLVDVVQENGALFGPLILMSMQGEQSIAARLDPLPPPPAVPAWGQELKARLLDPTDGRVYYVHSSTRAVPHNHAELLTNERPK